jgi:hypothetical protein
MDVSISPHPTETTALCIPSKPDTTSKHTSIYACAERVDKEGKGTREKNMGVGGTPLVVL